MNIHLHEIETSPGCTKVNTTQKRFPEREIQHVRKLAPLENVES